MIKPYIDPYIETNAIYTQPNISICYITYTTDFLSANYLMQVIDIKQNRIILKIFFHI